MAHFKSNAGRKRWLGLQKKTKYAVGGLTPTTNMYGSNTIPQNSSASLVYQQSNPEYQAQLADELTAVEEDTSYQDDANAVINKQNQVEGYGMRAANMGLNKVTDNVVEKGLEQGIEMPNSGDAKSMFAAGKDAFNAQRTINQGIKSTTKAIEGAQNTTQLLDGLNKVGTMGTKANAVGTGVKAFASSAGPAVVGQVVKGVGDQMMKKNDDGDASTVDKGAGVSSLGTGIGVGVTAGTLGTMAGIGAANIWNPLGWATLAATGIGAGISYLSKRRKAKKAGDAMDVAEMSRDADANSIKRQQRFEGLKNKQYSGFDYGGDNKGPGFYKRGGVKQYQSTGFKDVLAKPEGFQNPYAYNPSSKNDDIIAQNNRKVETNQIQTDETGLPTNRYTPSDNMSMEDIQRIMDTQGSIPLPEAEVVGDFVPQDIPKGADPYSNNSMEQKIFDNLGMNGVLEYRQNTSNQHAATAPFGAVASTVLGGGALAGGLTGTVGGQTLLRGGYNFLKAPVQKYGMGMINNAKNAWTGLNASGQTLSTGARVTSGIKSAIAGSSLQQLPDKAQGIGEGLLQEFSDKGGDLESRLRVSSNLTSFLPGFKQLKATLGNSGPTVKDTIKIAKDVEGGYYGNAMVRGGLSFLKGDQNKWVDKLNPEALDMAKSSIHLGGKQGFFKNILNYSDNASNSMLGTPQTEMREGGMRNLPGGQAIDIGNGATKYVGQTHKQGGIYPDPQSEVENDEIEAPVTLADGSTNPYIYSEYLKTDGTKNYDSSKKSIANVAEDLATNNAPQSEFDALAIQQEQLAGRSGNKIMNTTMAKYGGFQNTPANYKEGGVTQYQTRGLVMSEERQAQYNQHIKFIPNVGYVGPDGTNYGFNEADVVDFVNRGGLDSYNPNQGANYMPSEESMLGDRQQAFRDALRNNGQPAPTNEAVADPNFRRGQQGDLVVPADTTPTSIDPGNQDFNAINALGDQQRQREAAQQQQETQASEAEIDRVQAESAAREEAEAAAAEIPRSSIPAVGTEARRQYYDDNNWAYDDTIPGQGNYSPPASYDTSGSDPFGMVPSGSEPRTSSGLETPMFGGDPKNDLLNQIEEIELDEEEEFFDDEEINLTEKQKRKIRRKHPSIKDDYKSKWREKYEGRERGDGRLLKAAQFIPAAMAFMDKPDYMENPEKVGGIDRVNLENVSLDDRQAAIKSDNAAMQRFISNAGMGSAGFAARMAGWQKKEGLAAAVTAEQRRMNTEINNREATMNVDVDARNKAIQGENINRSMQIDRFNTESEAATKNQRVNAMATATQGLLTQFMDKQRIDADDRRTTAIAGQTGVMDREGWGIQTDRHFKGTGVTAQDDEYWNYYDKLANTEKKKFGGMRKIPSYGYSK